MQCSRECQVAHWPTGTAQYARAHRQPGRSLTCGGSSSSREARIKSLPNQPNIAEEPPVLWSHACTLSSCAEALDACEQACRASRGDGQGWRQQLPGRSGRVALPGWQLGASFWGT